MAVAIDPIYERLTGKPEVVTYYYWQEHRYITRMLVDIGKADRVEPVSGVKLRQEQLPEEYPYEWLRRRPDHPMARLYWRIVELLDHHGPLPAVTIASRTGYHHNYISARLRVWKHTFVPVGTKQYVMQNYGRRIRTRTQVRPLWGLVGVHDGQ